MDLAYKSLVDTKKELSVMEHKKQQTLELVI